MLNSLASTSEDRSLLGGTLTTLEDKYALNQKVIQEPGLEEIMKQILGRIFQAFGTLAMLRGQHILDIASGSNTTKAPSSVYVHTPFGEQHISIPHTEGYSAQFEPWFCRILLTLGADPVGIDLGNLDGEIFEHYHIDLGLPGGLDFLPDHSFDAVQDSRLFGSPEFTVQFPNQKDRLKVAAEIWGQEQRVLKSKGIVIHSDAVSLLS